MCHQIRNECNVCNGGKKVESEFKRIRRIDIQSHRDTTNYEHRRAGRSFIQSKTTRKFYRKAWDGKIVADHDQKPYPHSSTRQQARYARQIAAGQLSMDGVEGVPASVRRRLEKLTKNKEYGRIGVAHV